MPIYEYKCSACSHELEALQKFSDAPLVKCPACGRDALTKRVSAAGFQLKGSGWYQTDFRGGGAKPATSVPGAKAESGGDGAAKPAAGKDAAGGEAKPAATPAASSGTSSADA